MYLEQYKSRLQLAPAFSIDTSFLFPRFPCLNLAGVQPVHPELHPPEKLSIFKNKQNPCERGWRDDQITCNLGTYRIALWSLSFIPSSRIKAYGMVRAHEVASAASDQNFVLPRTPDRKVRVAGVSRVRLVDD